ncbi:MEDS domain-containing protein [Saccharomonospora sp. NPDC046836]|uniref:MEDS domain-containing protein n=1 Tax=Saccharomonospora sp. NPDC046836 TaxID=3156921 RepID=UPI0033CCA738
MRLSGEIKDTHRLGAHDHACWVYDDPAEFQAHAVEFLTAGLAQGQRVYYLADAGMHELLQVLRHVNGGDEALRRGAAQVHPIRTQDQALDPAEQVDAYAKATEAALADGYTGLRVAADETALIRGASRIDGFAHYEYLVDRYMTCNPFASFCAYDRTALGAEVVTQFACMHPVTSVGAAPFRLHASDSAALALCGELDLSTQDLLKLALERADPEPRNGELVIDASAVSFIDHRSLLLLARFAAERGATALLLTSSSGPARLVDILRLPGVRVERIT